MHLAVSWEIRALPSRMMRPKSPAQQASGAIAKRGSDDHVADSENCVGMDEGGGVDRLDAPIS